LLASKLGKKASTNLGAIQVSRCLWVWRVAMRHATGATERTAHDEVEHLIALHDGDAREAIRTLLKDCRELRRQLAVTAPAGDMALRGNSGATTHRFGMPDAACAGRGSSR
ncbi:MAG: hypothetical protein ACOH2J_21415, partial [Allorhizobium sp.]